MRDDKNKRTLKGRIILLATVYAIVKKYFNRACIDSIYDLVNIVNITNMIREFIKPSLDLDHVASGSPNVGKFE